MSLIKYYKLYIGCEIHIKCNIKKIFSNKKRNINIYDKNYPGILPNFNYKILKFIFLLNFILNGSCFCLSLIERKIYFYFDLPKNYQLTQNNFQHLFNLKINNFCSKKIILKKIHFEEDAASSKKEKNIIKINYKRSGNTLFELVTEPIFNNYNCIFLFLNKIKIFFLKNNISKTNMHLGEMRVDLNLSIINLINLKKSKKIEIKNLNSFENIKKTINYEFLRQIFFLEKKKFFSQTRNYNGKITFKLRKKCFSKNYNYDIDFDIGYLINFDFDFIKINYIKKKFLFLKFPKKKYLKLKFNNCLFLIKNYYYKKVNFNFFIIKLIIKNKKFFLFFLKKKKFFFFLKLNIYI